MYSQSTYHSQLLLEINKSVVMTKPARRNHRAQILGLQRHQVWAVLLLSVIGLMLDIKLGSQTLITKSMAAGAFLFYFSQQIFTSFAYRTTGAKVAKEVVFNMYAGLAVKWLITIGGFALIFGFLRPISSLSVLLSYFAMQILHVVVMWRANLDRLSN